jgi:hypothetical protein
MKQTLIALALLTALSANASERESQASQFLSATSNASATSSQSQQQTQNNAASAQGGSVGAITNGSAGGSSNVNVDNDTRMPASSAIAPSTGTSNDCQIATPSSKAVSLFPISVSGTTGVTYNDVCFAYKMKQFDIAEKLMCLKSQDYAKINPNCK